MRLADEAGVRLRSTDQEWRERTRFSAPGLVWVLESDTCLTGRVEAPDNVGYDENGCEFVYRQPRNEHELKNVLRAAWADPFDAYRFDGLDRWTYQDAHEWYETRQSLIQALDKPRRRHPELPAGVWVAAQDDVAVGMRTASAHYRSSEFHGAIAAVLAGLR